MLVALEQLSKILRTREAILDKFDRTMNGAFGDKKVFENTMELNAERVHKALEDLGLTPDSGAEDVFHALISRIRSHDESLSLYLKNPICSTTAGCKTVAALAQEIAGPTQGFFLKHEVAERLLRRNPPKNLMKELGIQKVDELLGKHRLEEIFPAVRFAEDPRWLNDVFFRPYEMLTPDDFETRNVEVLMLPDEWREIGKKFSGHKLHHLSHLKELGIIFVMPVTGHDHENPPGATLEILTLLLHYLVEVPYYSRVFHLSAQNQETFPEHIVSLLRGDVLPHVPNESPKTNRRFLIVQRYLSKDDPSDPRLFMPHVNPEAMHWEKVENKLAAFSQQKPNLPLGVWNGLGFVGNFFTLAAAKEEIISRGVEEETLISFDLIDNMISHNRSASLFSKYLYHQQEALWNRIFEGWIGKEQLGQMVEERLVKGYIEV